MNRLITSFLGWFGWSGALGEQSGRQNSGASGSLIPGTQALAPDGALQLSTVWACISLIANIIASLPLFVYTRSDKGQRELARDSLLWQILHDSPNSRMTPMEFWVALLLNLMLRGNAYARIERNDTGEAIAIWPMASDQVDPWMLPDGTLVYKYTVGSDVAVLAADNVLHIKGMGNGTTGLDRLDYMRASTTEAANAQGAASTLFASHGKPSGILMIDKVLNREQRDAVRNNFSAMSEGGTNRLFLLEADTKYQQLTLTPADQQLLETRRFTVEELCRWFGVPPVLVGHSNVTAWGSGIEQLIDGFHKLVIGPLVVNLQQAIAKRVLTPAQRARLSVEFSLDALLRANLKDRMDLYAKAVQNGLKTRNECRQLENDPPVTGGDQLTAQTNLAPLDMLGKIQGGGNAAQKDPIAQ
jgi:HK97 family phage portal protein